MSLPLFRLQSAQAKHRFHSTDVVDLVSREGGVFVQSALLAAAAGTFPDQAS